MGLSHPVWQDHSKGQLKSHHFQGFLLLLNEPRSLPHPQALPPPHLNSEAGPTFRASGFLIQAAAGPW